MTSTQVSILTPFLITLCSSFAIAGTITCENCPLPNPPVCLQGCIFQSPGEYALNGVLRMLENPDKLKKYTDEVNKNAGIALFDDAARWKGFTRVINVTQKTDFEKPKLVRSIFNNAVNAANIVTNCGPGEKVIGREASDTSTDEMRHEQEVNEDRKSSSTTTINVGVSYEKVFTASINKEATETLETRRRDLLAERRVLEQRLVLKDNVTIPAYSYVDETVTQTTGTETYIATGIMTTDAKIFVDSIIGKFPGASWSDYADIAARQLPITGGFEIPIHEILARHDIYTFSDTESCITGAANQVEHYRAAVDH
jgi:hypothetical protein